MARETRVMIMFGSRVAEVACMKGKEPVIRMLESLEADEAAVVNVITETLRCFSSGKSIDRYFNPTIDNAKQDELLHMQWDRHGKLIEVGIADDKFMHAATVADAVKRRRKFTCFRSLIPLLPQFKDGLKHGTEN